MTIQRMACPYSRRRDVTCRNQGWMVCPQCGERVEVLGGRLQWHTARLPEALQCNPS